jgi:signal transduction histidine kinase
LFLLALTPSLFGQIVLRPLPTNCITLSDGLGRFHAGPAHWTLEGGASHAFFGERLARPADFNRDGRAELPVSAPRSYHNGEEAGRIWLLDWSSSGVPVARWTWTGQVRAQRPASALAAGDFNGDGFADLAWGSPRGVRSGRVALFQGGATNLSRGFSNVLYGMATGSQFGFALAAADFNRDGFADLLVGQPGREQRRGRVLAYRGGPGGYSTNAFWTASGGSAGEGFGETLAVLDANGDGAPDLAAGSPLHDDGARTNAGRVRLFLGTNGAFAPEAAWSFNGPVAHGGLGYGLANLGDLDRDGREELGIGAPGVRQGNNWPGQVWIFKGTTNGLGRAPAWTVQGAAADSGLGRSLAGLGDLNGDGWPDVAVGFPGVDESMSRASGLGGASVFLGGPAGLAREAAWSVRCAHAKSLTGWGLAALGDVNGDGLADFAVSSPFFTLHEEGLRMVGRVDVFLGHREGYAQPDKFPMDRVNSSTHEQAIADLTRRAGEVNADQAARIRVEANALSSFAQETRRVQTANLRATHWLRWLGWSAPVLAMGLAFVWRRQRRRHAQAAVRRERERLARDLHDGLGSGVHRLQRLTELLGWTEAGSEELTKLREDMLKTAQELSGSLDRTVWAVKPENDTLENLVNFLATYAPSVLEPHGIECELDLPPSLPSVALHGDTRQNVFLVVNEALQNVVKHAGARRVWLRAQWNAPMLAIQIEDDGMGLNTESAAPRRVFGGNGLLNQRQRLEGLGGALAVQPGVAGGTMVGIRLPINGTAPLPRRDPTVEVEA